MSTGPVYTYPIAGQTVVVEQPDPAASPSRPNAATWPALRQQLVILIPAPCGFGRGGMRAGSVSTLRNDRVCRVVAVWPACTATSQVLRTRLAAPTWSRSVLG